jgi:hypothetical protein
MRSFSLLAPLIRSEQFLFQTASSQLLVHFLSLEIYFSLALGQETLSEPQHSALLLKKLGQKVSQGRHSICSDAQIGLSTSV